MHFSFHSIDYLTSTRYSNQSSNQRTGQRQIKRNSHARNEKTKGYSLFHLSRPVARPLSTALFQLSVTSWERSCQPINFSSPPIVLTFRTFNDLNSIANREREVSFRLSSAKVTAVRMSLLLGKSGYHRDHSVVTHLSGKVEQGDTVLNVGSRSHPFHWGRRRRGLFDRSGRSQTRCSARGIRRRRSGGGNASGGRRRHAVLGGRALSCESRCLSR